MRHAQHLLRSAHFAPPLALARALAEIQARYGVSFDRARVRAGFARGHLLEIVVSLPGGRGAAHETDAAEALVQRLLGDEIFERWVGNVVVTPSAGGGPLQVLNSQSEPSSALPLDTLAETIRAAIQGLKSGLPDLPASDTDEADDWVLFELEPELADDYAAQDDLVMCSTRMPESKKCFLRGQPFFSGRFTNSGALFVYLKYAAPEHDPARRLSERARLEELIRRSLTRAEGVVVGVGLGVRYDYIDLALIDIAVQHALLPRLQEAGIPKRAWLLFCDSELSGHSVSVHADSPEPFRGPRPG